MVYPNFNRKKITVIDIKAEEKKLFDIVNPDLEFGASPEAIKYAKALALRLDIEFQEYEQSHII